MGVTRVGASYIRQGRLSFPTQPCSSPRHVRIIRLVALPSVSLPSHFDSLASISHREWLTNSSAPPRTDPSYLSPKSSTAYTPSNSIILAPVPSRPLHLTPQRASSPPKEHMPIDCSTLFSLARSKLQLSVSNKDSCSLHRWVLLKNSINSPTLSSSNSSDLPDVHPTYSEDDDDESADEGLEPVTVHTYMFPDAGNLADTQPDAQTSEAQWLDSLLETLGDDDDDYFGSDSDPQLASTSEDDEEHLFSPSESPMSSSDDLPDMQPSFFAYSTSYPSYTPSLADPPFDSSISSLPPPYEDPLPYCDPDDVDDLAVPDTIEDTSDDESEAPQTPSLGRSTSPLSFIDAASIPLPPERTNFSHAGFRVLFDEDSCFYPFDPLPFSEDDVHSYNFYREC